MSTTIGAHVHVTDPTGQNPDHTVYVSFGQYDETTDTDTFGIRDIRIAYYMTPDELRNSPTTPDEYYEIIGYDYETREDV